MGVFDNITPTPAAPAAGVFSKVTPAAPSGGGVFSGVTATPKVAPASPQAAPSPYFEGKEPTGTFIGISDQKDPYSGKPFLAYRLPGANATTTDTTRVAPKVNPEVAAPTAKDTFQNPRMPESASHDIRVTEGATKNQELDHRMALTLGGSNDKSNLKLIPTSDNQAASSAEGAMTEQVAQGKLSLFQAQLNEAKAKGLPTPFTDQPAQPGSLWDKITSGAPGLIGSSKEIAADAGKEVLTLGKQGYDAWNGFLRQNVLQPYLTAVGAAGNASADVTANLSNQDGTLKPINKIDWASATANELKLLSAGLGAVADPGMVPYQVANAVPVVGHVLDPLNFVFKEAGVAGGALANGFGLTTAVINKLPISKDDKEQLSNSIQDVGSTLGQFAVGAYLFGRAGKAIEMKGNPVANFKDLTIGDAKDLVDSTKKFAAAVKARLPQTMAEAQRGFAKLPGIGEETPKEENKNIEDHTQDIKDAYAAVPNAQEHLDNLHAELFDLAEPGERIFNEDGSVTAKPSTFPQWIPEELRSKALFDKVFGGVEKVGDIKYPENPRATKQRELYNELLGTLDERMGVDTSASRDAILKQYEDGTNAGKEKATAVARDRGAQRGQERGTETAPGEKVEIPPLTKTAAQLGVPHPSENSSLTDLALQQKTPHDFFLALTDGERQKVLLAIDPDGRGLTEEEAAHAYYASAKSNIAPRDQELPKSKQQNDNRTGTKRTRQPQGLRPLSQVIAEGRKNPAIERSSPLEPIKSSYNETITEHNGGVNPPENKGGLEAPEIDWSKGKDIAAIRQSTDTLERTLEKVFPREEAAKLNEFLTQADRKNEAAKARYVTDVRTETQKYVVKELGIKPATAKSAWVQRLGEGRTTIEELRRKMPNDWENIAKASEFFRGKYDELIDKWNAERAKAGMKPINKRPNYFRHFIDLSSWSNMYGLDFRESSLPTAISGLTEFFRSQSPWTNAAMRRLGNTTTDDAVGGFDNYLDSAARAIFHTDTVQRGRLVDKYLREAADANAHAAQDIRDSGEDKLTPPPIKMPRLANTLKQWTDKVSGKQNIVDRVIESIVGRNSIAVMRAITRQFGLNVIGGNIGAAVTHAIPTVYTLATTDKGAAFHGLYGTLTSPFLEDFRKIDGVTSDFLSRRFGKGEIEPTLGEKAAGVISAPFHWVDQFMSRFAVEGKYHEGIYKGLTPQEAMKAADNYASRVVGDRSSGNLPPVMSSKLLGPLTQFQIEVNDNLRVLLHDIPYDAKGDVLKIANRFAQFALYSYLFNQTMQYIKGSGKGLDPIDMGLTILGLNDEGHDKSLQDRLAAAGNDFLKEMPFTSVYTGGQIPAFQPLQQAKNDAETGSPLKALEGVLASFASPIGGGQQVMKSLTAIQAWRQGYVTDSKGKITATVPQTLPTLAQGVLFGKSAFDSVKKANSEIANLDTTLKEGQAASKLKNQQADNLWLQLKGMPQDKAKAQLLQIAQQDPDMAKRVLAAAKTDALNITKQDTLLKSLGVADGARATYIANKLSGMSTDEEKKAYLTDLATKKILTDAVLTQVVALLKK